MGEIVDKAKKKVQKGYSNLKKLISLLMIWGLIFSIATIGRFCVAFDYDDTLVFSTPAFNKAYSSGAIPSSPQFWKIVNESYDLEKPKLLTNAIAWAFRLLGFRITVMAGRGPYGGDALKKEWRHLVSKFVFAAGPDAKRLVLNQGDYLLVFGDSDSDIEQSRKAHVFPVRVRRSPKSMFKDDYHPGALHEIIIPLSEY